MIIHFAFPLYYPVIVLSFFKKISLYISLEVGLKWQKTYYNGSWNLTGYWDPHGCEFNPCNIFQNSNSFKFISFRGHTITAICVSTTVLLLRHIVLLNPLCKGKIDSCESIKLLMDFPSENEVWWVNFLRVPLGSQTLCEYQTLYIQMMMAQRQNGTEIMFHLSPIW